MKTVHLIRTLYENDGTFGILTIEGTDFSCVTAERPWIENKKGISCIPEGIYSSSFEDSPRFKRPLYRLHSVPNREGVLIHNANFPSQLDGCIAIGKTRTTFPNGKTGITASKQTLVTFHSIMKGENGKIFISYKKGKED